MRKFWIIMLILLGMSIYSQELGLNEIFELWEIEVVSIQLEDNEVLIEDRVTSNPEEARNMLYSILYALVDEIEYEGYTAQNLKFETLYYVVLHEADRYEFVINKNWIVLNFEGKKDKDKMDMVQALINQ